MTVASLNENIEFVELPSVPAAGAAAAESSHAIVERVEDKMGQIDELWDLMSRSDERDIPVANYSIPSDLTLSVVIPVYNERHTILEVISRVKSLPLHTEIIVVDDCSTDGTRGWLETIKGASGLRVIFKDQNEGKGSALKAGFAAATGQIVVIQDADLEYDPTDILRVIEPLVGGTADVVYGSRFLGEEQQDKSRLHRMGNRALTELSNYFTGLRLTDMETCYKAFRRGVIRDLSLRQNRFGFEPEVTAKIARRRYRIAEVPISYDARDYRAGKKIGVRDAFNALYCIVRYALAD